MAKRILDACCGGRMFWFDRKNEDTVFMDYREYDGDLCDGRHFEVKPDLIGDFRSIPFGDDTFYMVVFDPPHLLHIGESAYLAKKYGKLTDNWRNDIAKGFDECMRVLKPNGTLIFKWNEEQIKLSEVLSLIPYKPLFGNRRAKTHWLCFMKEVGNNE